MNIEEKCIIKGMKLIEEKCIAKGMKLTGQRKLIAKVLSESDDHPDVDELYKRISLIDKKISIPTIYRTLRLFEEAGIIEKLDFGDGRARYENSGADNHHHLIDTDTGKVVEFNNAELETLISKIATELGYKLQDHELKLYGSLLKKD